MATKRTKASPNANGNSEAPTTAPAAPAARTPSTDAIAARAYEIWRASGGADGHDKADWYQAERELRTRQTAR